jgi:ADP-ribose pyrophosphatase YjhB (NUDIX family)
VLLQRRSDFGDAWWGLPGGVLEMGETIAACCRRETLEETGLVIEPLRLAGLYSSPRYDVRYPNGDEVQQITAAFECRAIGGQLRAESGEVDALHYFEPAALPALPLWYADMLGHCLAGEPAAYFDPPEFRQAGQPESEFWAMRAAFGQAPFIAAGAAVVARDERGRVLLHQRGDTGEWGLPAGTLDLGETLAATAVRETREETGLEVAPLRLVGLYSGFEVAYPNGDRLCIFNSTFECRVTGGELRPDGRESLDARFFDPGDLPPLSARFTQRVADALAGRAEAFVR